MQWIGGLTDKKKDELKRNWHQHFAWYPVCCGVTADNCKIYAWLEYVNRKGTYYASFLGSNWDWEYKL
jgi:hypothetical protein